MAQANGTNWRNLITVVSIMILVGAEVFGVAISAGWAIAGLFELGDIAAYVLMGLFSLLGLWAMLALWRNSVAIFAYSARGIFRCRIMCSVLPSWPFQKQPSWE